MAWITLTLNVTTPLFNGDGSTALRVSTLRGAMRYWFRALAASRVGPDIAALARLEQRVFGTTETASPLRLRIPPTLTAKTAPNPAWLRRPNGAWIGYLLGQGHQSVKDGVTTITRPFTPPGPHANLTLKIRLSDNDAVDALALASLWLVCAYGGVGARTRRGFGGLRITGADGPLPHPWTADTITTPGLDHYGTLTCLAPTGALADCDQHLAELLPPDHPGARDDPDRKPAYPALSAHHTRARLGAFTATSWDELAAHVGEQFRLARATTDNSASATRYQPKVKTPEHLTVIKGRRDEFALGAFGLPVNYPKDNASVTPSASDRTQLRRASPLWLRLIGDNGQWRLLSFAFHSQFLPGPDAPTVHLWKGGQRGRPLNTTDDQVRTRTTEWIDQMAEKPAPYPRP